MTCWNSHGNYSIHTGYNLPDGHQFKLYDNHSAGIKLLRGSYLPENKSLQCRWVYMAASQCTAIHRVSINTCAGWLLYNVLTLHVPLAFLSWHICNWLPWMSCVMVYSVSTDTVLYILSRKATIVVGNETLMVLYQLCWSRKLSYVMRIKNNNNNNIRNN